MTAALQQTDSAALGVRSDEIMQRLSERIDPRSGARAQLINSGNRHTRPALAFDFSACRDEAEKKQRRSRTVCIAAPR